MSVMRASPRRRPAAAALLALVSSAALALPGSAQAQGAGRGFLFHEPFGNLTLRGGFARASARSDIFSFATDQLTLSRSDFDGATFGADFAFHVAPRLAVTFGAGYAASSARSEFRDWVESTDAGDKPIEQTTTFRRVPLAAGLKLYVTPPGRSIGRFAWVPARTALYVGAGGGMTYYRFGQQGDFVDAKTTNIFTTSLVSNGWTPSALGMAGVDLSLGSYFALTTEARYSWAKARMDDQFENFNPIDLSGYTATIGLTIRY